MKKIKKAIVTLIAVTLVACGSSRSTGESELLSPQDFSKVIASNADYMLIDVRSPEEFALNHLEGAKNINVNGASFKETVSNIDKGKIVLVYCKSGGRSHNAFIQLKELGYTVKDLDGGILKWQAANLPIAIDKKKSNTGYTLESYMNEVTSDEVVLVDFYATWCGPCKMMAPHITELKSKYKNEVKIIKVDTDKSMEVSQHFKISGIPLIKVYKNGKEVYNEMGYHPLEKLETVLKKHI